MNQTELLAPAGSLKHLRYAFAYGADAVYAGQPRYSLRVRNNDFGKLDVLAQGIAYAHKRGKKFYIASNIAPHNAKLKTYENDLEPLIALKPDALIMSDPGLIMMVRDRWPDQCIHLSVQANAVNYKTVEFWQRMGLTRVILSRELSLDEIHEIREHCPQMELEVFVHGALCIAYSGRCLLSGYMNHRDPNQGTCTNACRWKYQAHEATETPEGDIVATNAMPNVNQSATQVHQETTEQTPEPGMFLLQEQNRPGEYMPAFEDEHGTYIMNSKDLRAVEHVERLVTMGVHSLKIEGRTKSHFYVARTTQVYRSAIDSALASKPFDPALLQQLDSLSNRGYTEGFYRRHRPAELQTYDAGNSVASQQQFVGEVIDYTLGDKWLTIDTKNRFSVGDTLEIMTPSGNQRFILEVMRDKHDQHISVAPGSGHVVTIPAVDVSVDYEFALILRDLAEPISS